ncbi:MAG: DUF3095 domain-containing protein [Pseudomonadota bacterium]|jgi:hypothetical protein|nr:DUF3095 domain-containing protein [Pseudomonadota bacterium]QKK06175.1 MAG: DUF3095 domain-containing protein [Pseudomonadota bacterium]|tara:strand:- start:153 stop:1343 length:1191 start_codon:yes stop_codon:yes gene_type:complete
MDFYKNIPPVNDFRAVLNDSHYHNVPQDWLIAVADVEGSTKAVAAGQYKQVNALGAAAVTAVLNALGDLEIPFVFGGDGASFVFPPAAANAVCAALSGAQDLAASVFSLELRAGILPVSAVTDSRHSVKICKFKINDSLYLAMFAGGGLARAEDMIKADPAHSVRHFADADYLKKNPADFTGFQCRWQNVKSEKGENVTLMIKAHPAKSATAALIYDEILSGIRKIYGMDEAETHPLPLKNLNLTQDKKLLFSDIGINNYRKSAVKKALYAAGIPHAMKIGQWLMDKGKKMGDFDGAQYRAAVRRQSDWRKFDDTLRMVLDSAPEQTARLKAFLDGRKNENRIFYGIHTAKSALLTCMVFDRAERHLHFVDGADGGYTLAAAQMKEQMAQNMRDSG